MNIVLRAQMRDTNVKPKSLIKDGWVPACLYAHNFESVPIQLPSKKLDESISKNPSKIELHIDGSGRYLAALKEVQRLALEGGIIHISFHALDEGTATTLQVPVRLKKAAKVEGEISQPIHEITLKGRPSEIPDEIVVDTTHIKIGEHIKVADIEKDYAFEFLEEDREKILASCRHAKVQPTEPDTTQSEPAMEEKSKEQAKEQG